MSVWFGAVVPDTIFAFPPCLIQIAFDLYVCHLDTSDSAAGSRRPRRIPCCGQVRPAAGLDGFDLGLVDELVDHVLSDVLVGALFRLRGLGDLDSRGLPRRPVPTDECPQAECRHIHHRPQTIVSHPFTRRMNTGSPWRIPLPEPVARGIITHHPAVAREWARWRAMGGPRGEILLVNRAIVELGLTC